MSVSISEEDWGKQAILSVDVYNPVCGSLSIQYFEVGANERSSTAIPINTEFTQTSFTVSSTISVNTTDLELRIVMQNNSDTSPVPVYIDNACMVIQ